MASTRSISVLGIGGVGLGDAGGALPFVRLDAHELDARRWRAGREASATASSCVRQPVRAPSTPISSITSKGTLVRMALGPVFDRARAARSESTRNTTRRPACRAQQQLDARQVFIAHHLVGDQRAARARPPRPRPVA